MTLFEQLSQLADDTILFAACALETDCSGDRIDRSYKAVSLLSDDWLHLVQARIASGDADGAAEVSRILGRLQREFAAIVQPYDESSPRFLIH